MITVEVLPINGINNLNNLFEKKLDMTKNKIKALELLKKIVWHSEEFLNRNTYEYCIPPDYPIEYRTIFGTTPVVHTCISNDKIINIPEYKKLQKFLVENGFVAMEQSSVSFKFINIEAKILISGDQNQDDDEDEEDNELERVSSDPVFMNFCPNEKYRKLIEKIVVKIDSLLTEKIKIKNNFYMIAENRNGLYNLETRFKAIPIKDNRYDIFYGTDFPHERISRFISEETENLMLLHGDPGTGKSNYIKQIITDSKRDVIYIPPSMLSVIASPSFITYMMENRGAILLIEDAEEVLSVDRNSATNNLLGLTDGFLKDSLDLKVIATFNCSIGKIDPALMRKGRMYFEYKFDKLPVSDVTKLSDFMELGLNPTEPMTLAEIFNKENVSIKNSFEERRMGFC